MAKPLELTLAIVAAVLAIVAGMFLLPGSRARRPQVRRRRASSGGALTASLRSEPAHYNRYLDPKAAADLLSLLMHARLVRINRATDELEPALAESWTPSPTVSNTSLRAHYYDLLVRVHVG